MTASHKLSPMTSYYIRKLYQQRSAQGLQASQNASEGTVPLLDCEALLRKACTTADEMATQVKNLEILVQFHQNLVGRNTSFGPAPSQVAQLRQLEEKIFSILGEPIPPSPPPEDTSPPRISVAKATSQPITAQKSIERQPPLPNRFNSEQKLERQAPLANGSSSEQRPAVEPLPVAEGFASTVKGAISAAAPEVLDTEKPALTTKPAKPSKTDGIENSSVPHSNPVVQPDPTKGIPQNVELEAVQDDEQDILASLYTEFQKVEQDIQQLLDSESP